jgi:glycosyltransferase involved in cell wall biosynthesis
VIRISIIVPNYNMGFYLEKLLRNIRAETYGNLELIIIDGGSTDNSKQIILDNLDLITFWRSEPDEGQGAAVEKGISLSTGDVLHWHASDDLLVPGTLARVNRIFSQDETIDLLISDGLALVKQRLVYTGQSRFFNAKSCLYWFDRFQSDCAYWRSNLTPFGVPLNCAMPLTVDEDFFLRLAVRARRILWVSKPLGVFRLHGAQVSQRGDSSGVRDARRKSRQLIFDQLNLSSNEILLRRLYFGPLYALVKVFRIAFRVLRKIRDFGTKNSAPKHVASQTRAYW